MKELSLVTNNLATFSDYSSISLTPVRRAKQSKTKNTQLSHWGTVLSSSNFLVIYLVMGGVIIASQPSSPLVLCLHCQSLLSTRMAQPT